MIERRLTIAELHRFLRLSGLLFDAAKTTGCEIPSMEWLVNWILGKE